MALMQTIIIHINVIHNILLQMVGLYVTHLPDSNKTKIIFLARI